MKRISKIVVCVCAFLIGMCARVYAALPGTTCGTAIPLGDNYSAPITGPFPKSVWYSAWTFDLPLTVKFVPNSPSDPAPEVEMDFTCTKGIYTDSILCSMFCPNESSSGIDFEMPHHPSLSSKTENGVFFYYLAMGKTYRDLLLKTGIDYNVQVLVKVTYKASGNISLEPDDTFSNCMDGHKFMHLGDTVQVKALDKDRHVIVPYVQWQEDSIRYVWNGTAPVTVAVGYACTFDPTDNGDETILDFFELQPQDTIKLTSAELKHYVKEANSEAGMFYAKFYTSGTGTMKIERVPQAPPRGGAALLRYGRIAQVPADTSKLFAIPYTWDTATIFTTPTDHIFRMYIGTEPDFYLRDAIATYQFKANENGHWLGLTDAEMQALWTQTTEQYLYVRFECSEKTTIKPEEWDLPTCFTGNTAGGEIHRPSTTLSVEKGTNSVKYYRFYYSEWAGGDMTFQWKNSSGACPTFIGMTCSFPTIATNANVLTNRTIAKNGTWTISANDIAEWAEYVDENGYLYIRFNPGNVGKMTISTTAPEEQDPAPVVYPTAGIAVACDGEPTAEGQRYIVRVKEEQDLAVYPGPIHEIASRTPIASWHQTATETHTLTLAPGTYVLQGAQEQVEIIVP